MGGSSSTRRESAQPIQPLEISEFRNLEEPLDFVVMPEIPEKRSVTDKGFTMFFVVVLIVLLSFLIHAFTEADLNRFRRGYDKCGNICGKYNRHYDGISCSGRDETSKPFLRMYEVHNGHLVTEKTCVESCGPEDYVIMNRCFKEDGQAGYRMAEIAGNLNKSAGKIVLLCFIGLGLSVGMLLLFRYFTAAVVWIILIGSMLAIYIFTGFLWAASNDYKMAAIFCTILAVALTIIFLCLFQRIQLVIRLFKEAIQIIFGMPLILLEPLLTLLASILLITVFVSFLMIFETIGDLHEVQGGVYEYVPDSLTIFTFCFHLIICLWMTQIIIGCQHMVIAGAVSTYYFARDKRALVSPIYYSFYNLLKYHLGTVVFGSLIITMITLFKITMRSLASSRFGKIFVECCLQYIENVVRFISKNAYIQTAIHGQSFCKSGKRAVQLLAANYLTTIAVNSVGDFVMVMCKIFIVLATVGFGFLIKDPSEDNWGVAIVICAIVTAIIAHAFFSVFETAVDTILMCFCEDNVLNNGMDRPYYMTTNLMQYIEDAKKGVKKT